MLGGENGSAAARATGSFGRLDRFSIEHFRLVVLHAGGQRVAHEEGRAAAETVPLGAELFGVAQLAVDVAVGTVARQHRVEHAVAFAAVEAALVPHLHPSQSINSLDY